VSIYEDKNEDGSRAGIWRIKREISIEEEGETNKAI